MKKYLADYQRLNPEKFNGKLLRSKNDSDLLREVKTVFQSLELIPSLRVADVRIDDREETYGPIRATDDKEHKTYYKSTQPSRLVKIHYSIAVDGLETKIEQDLYMLRLLDNNYYINQGTHYFPIWEIVPNLTIHSRNALMVKPAAMPLSLIKSTTIQAVAEHSKLILNNLPVFDVLMFNKSLPLMYYIAGKKAIDEYNREIIGDVPNKTVNPTDVEKMQNWKTTAIIDAINDYWSLHLKFSDDPESLNIDDRVVFKQENGVAFSLSKSEAESVNGRIAIASLLCCTDTTSNKSRKKKRQYLTFTYDQLITPWYWIDLVGQTFTRGNDIFKRYRKANSIFISVDRVIDISAQKSMPIADMYKENCYTVLRYLCRNFDDLMKRDNNDLKNMKLNLYEYILYPLRIKLAKKINQLSNQSTVTPDDIKKIFKGLSPMFLIQELVKSGLIHIYEGTNDMNVFCETLKCTFVGPAGGAGSNLTLSQRDLQPSFNGRLDLVAASPGNPGPTSILVPFGDITDGKFSNELVKDIDEKEKNTDAREI